MAPLPEPLLTLRQITILKRLADVGIQTDEQLYDFRDIRASCSRAALKNQLDRLCNSKHVLFSWPNKYSIKDKGRQAIAHIR